ncbi:DJ-1/PfpI family protein [Marinomonas transparens]|uniref:DJ-1/PfpI family protein n=1 Tax=Marinomonas transparens TaxID=2795388 RepID=A0A934MZL4_9GAMM|nr:DJ-1/PfpI family protein [Marinomonas transparens]MBJ7537670.1 DJ-1/PfpI family protein [Marinomonas transparens]
MKISILTFEGFNELDSLIAFGILSRVKKPDWQVSITSPTSQVCSMNGLVLEATKTLSDIADDDVVLIGSGLKTREVVADELLMAQLKLDPTRQLIGAQCSGALILEKLGLLKKMPVCTDLTTAPWVKETGVKVLDQAFYAEQNIASSGGCLASLYLACWVIARAEGLEEAKEQMHYFAPVGEKEAYVEAMVRNISPYLGKV